jgi:hypothetical protein
MAEITVSCACGRKMTEVGTEVKGTYACRCGTKVRVVIGRQRPSCAYQGGEKPCPFPLPTESRRLGLPFCAEHLAEVAGRIEDAMSARLDERIRRLELVTMQMEAARATWDDDKLSSAQIRYAAEVADQIKATLSPHVVYYIRTGDRIKIGTTADLRKRMAALMPDEVLAAEPGAREVERERLRQFRHLRIAGERFAPGDDLTAHISAVRKEHGDPWKVKGVLPAPELPDWHYGKQDAPVLGPAPDA